MNLPSSDLAWPWVLEFLMIYFFLHKAYYVISTLGGVRWWRSSWPVLRYQCVVRCPASRECDRVGVHAWPWTWKFEKTRSNLSKRLMLPWNLSPHFLKKLLTTVHIGGNKREWNSRSRIGLYICLRLARHFFQFESSMLTKSFMISVFSLNPHYCPLRISGKIYSCAAWMVSSPLSLIRFPVSRYRINLRCRPFRQMLDYIKVTAFR